MTCKACGENKELKASGYVQRAIKLMEEAEVDGAGNATALFRLKEVAAILPEVAERKLAQIKRTGHPQAQKAAHRPLPVSDETKQIENEVIREAILRAAEEGSDVIGAYGKARAALIRAKRQADGEAPSA